jgi:cellulose synthase/poly-beta-1,6-N-acetylglucosamine synthase-like glycosyltransferase
MMRRRAECMFKNHAEDRQRMEILSAVLYVSIFILLYLTITFIVLFALKHRSVHFTPKIMKDGELPALSVVVPVYNEGETLRLGLDAIAKSDYPKKKLEVIIVDDCSKDNSYAIAKEYEKHGFKIIRKEKNSGASDSKNVGINAASGELVATLDSDSVVESGTFRNLASYFADPKVGGVAAAIRVREPKNILEKVQAFEYDSILFLRRLMMAVDSIYVTPGGLSMFRRDAMLKIGGFDPQSLTEDQEVALKLQKKGYRIRCSLDAFVYTAAMPRLDLLVKQRVRWVRGGIWNRIKHKDLFSLDYGDFLFFGMMTDLLVFIPSIILISSIVYNIVKPSSFWGERIGNANFTYGYFSDPIIIVTVSMVLITALWLMYTVNNIRSYAKQKPISILREAPEMFVYLFVFGYIWPYIWVTSLAMEIMGKEKAWSTR